MANIRRYNREEALGNILNVFWRKGYGDASIDDLTEATGMKRQSLYSAFGDKQAMFDAAYDHYLATTGELSSHALKKDDPLEVISGILRCYADVVCDKNTPAGCFLTNTAVEFGGENNPVADKILNHFSGLEEMFHLQILKAQKQKKIDADSDPQALARFLTATTTSVAVLYKLKQDKQFVDDVIKETLKHLTQNT